MVLDPQVLQYSQGDTPIGSLNRYDVAMGGMGGFGGGGSGQRTEMLFRVLTSEHDWGHCFQIATS